MERITWLTAQLGERVTGADYVRATQTAHRLGRQMAAFHARMGRAADAGARDLPVKLGWIDMMMDDVDEYWRRVFAFSPFTVWFNLTGQPAMMLPLGTARTGGAAAVAVQLVHASATRPRYSDWRRSWRKLAPGSPAAPRSPRSAEPPFGRRPAPSRRGRSCTTRARFEGPTSSG